jgi:tRNA G18 (ribose-2'-O)-methylase SpoU
VAESFAELSEKLKASGWQIYALDESATESLYAKELPQKTVFVIGTEGAGLSRAAREKIDGLLQIPIAGAASSLNMSIAASLALYEYRRRYPVTL